MYVSAILLTAPTKILKEPKQCSALETGKASFKNKQRHASGKRKILQIGKIHLIFKPMLKQACFSEKEILMKMKLRERFNKIYEEKV